MSALLTFNVAKGEDVTFSGSLTQPPGVFPGGPIDITGYTLLVTILTPAGIAFLTKAGTITSATVGTFTWALARADTVSATAGVYSIDIWRTDTGQQRELGKGSLIITGDARTP